MTLSPEQTKIVVQYIGTIGFAQPTLHEQLEHFKPVLELFGNNSDIAHAYQEQLTRVTQVDELVHSMTAPGNVA